MALVLRMDVDKPYGRSNIFAKILSKTREDFFFPAIEKLGYLKHLNMVLDFLEDSAIPSHIYFRICTIPSIRIINKLEKHKVGFHAENTQTIDTFKCELDIFRSKIPGLDISSFTKHGSGIAKLGKNHYPPYEPSKYLLWSKKLNIEYLFGNSTWCSPHTTTRSYYENMYWVNNSSRTKEQPTTEQIVQKAKLENIVILIHPENYIAEKQVNNDFCEIVHYSKQESVNWILL